MQASLRRRPPPRAVAAVIAVIAAAGVADAAVSAVNVAAVTVASAGKTCLCALDKRDGLAVIPFLSASRFYLFENRDLTSAGISATFTISMPLPFLSNRLYDDT